MKFRFAAALMAGVAVAGLGAAQAEEFTALRSGNTLVNFDSAAPTTIRSSVTVTGLGAGQTLVGVDVRPATNRVLYGLTNTGHLYAINRTTGAASLVTATGVTPPTLSGTAFGVDFNPVVDRLRVVSNTGQNLRINPNDGSLSATDGTLAYAVGDVNFGATPNFVGAAYTNNFAGATTTTLYVLDPVSGRLAIQNPPNAGTINTVGALGVTGNNSAGFDISSASGTAYAVITNAGSGISSLYTINLTTGAATLVGQLAGATSYNGLALAATPFSEIGTTDSQRAVGGALDNFTVAPSAGLVGLFAALDSSPAATASGLGQLTPQSYANLTELGRLSAEQQIRAVSNHLTDLRQGSTNGDAVGGAFFDIGLTRAKFAAGDDRTASRADINNFILGGDQVWGNILLGGAVIYNDTRSGLDFQNGHAKGESWGGTVFGSWGLGNGYVELQGLASKGDVELRRTVNIGGGSETHTANPNTRFLGASAKVGVNYDFNGVGVEPFVALQYSESTVRDFAEEGGGVTALSVRQWAQQSLQSKLGARVSGGFQAGGALVRPELRAAYVFEHNDDPTEIDARLYNTGTAVFRTTALQTDLEEGAEVGLGVSVIGLRAATFRFDYEGKFGGDHNQHGASMKVRFPF